jgi:hypothetical protein
MDIASARALKASRFRLRLQRNALVERLRAPYRPRETEQVWSDLRGVCEQLVFMDERLATEFAASCDPEISLLLFGCQNR